MGSQSGSEHWVHRRSKKREYNNVRELDGRSTSYDDDDGLLDLVSVFVDSGAKREVRWSVCTTIGVGDGGRLLCIEGRGGEHVGSSGRRETRGGIMVKQ